ncbi:MAG: putative zinc-binding metallopeptidase [Gammaproteobacteria bacterium]
MSPFTNPWWARLDDEALLDLRFRDLKLKLADSPLEPALDRLYRELGKRGFRFRPHVWLSVEWFCPDGVPGFAIPFYLVHPRLAALERRQMHEVEGGNARWLQRILRHETGHALDNAYRLRRRKRWRQVFGPASRPYPSRYAPRTTSRDFVMHLGHWYAQSHPTEDFAETFAVWLAPNSTWRTDYEHWHAQRKLRYVDELMAEVRAEPAPVRRRTQVEPLRSNNATLREHYAAKLSSQDRTETRRYDRRLRRVFAPPDGSPGQPSAATFLRQVRPELRRLLVRRSRLHPYLVHHVLRLVIRRSRELELGVNQPLRVTKREAFSLVEQILFDFVRRGRERYTL